MSSSSVQDWVNTSLNTITHETFTDCVKVTDVELKPMTDQLVVIVSDIFRVTLTLHFKNGDTKKLKGVFKTQSTKGGFAKLAEELTLNTNETMVYRNYLRRMEELLKSNEGSEEIPWPDCYLSNTTNLLLQDLCEENYRVVPTTNLLNPEHVEVALKMIGKYHGLGLVLKQEGTLDLNELPVHYLTRKLDFINNIYSGSLNALANVMEKRWKPEWRSVSEKLIKEAENVNDKLAQLVNSTQGKCSVLNQGDFTMRNILFKYENPDKLENPIHAKMIDFQVPSWANLGFDLISLLGCSTLPQTRDKHIDEWLNIYAESLSETCSKHGYRGYVPTLSDVQESYKSLGYLLLLTTVFALPALFQAGKDFKPDSLLENNKNGFDSSFYDSDVIKNEFKYQLRMSLKQNIL